jgi:hypothetical protein
MLVSMLSMIRLRIRRTDFAKKSMQELKNSIVISKKCSSVGKKRNQKRETISLERKLLRLLK